MTPYLQEAIIFKFTDFYGVVNSNTYAFSIDVSFMRGQCYSKKTEIIKLNLTVNCVIFPCELLFRKTLETSLKNITVIALVPSPERDGKSFFAEDTTHFSCRTLRRPP